ncbi:hypothetical protein R3P38DRAFT_2923366 [Favolaschia claudopus]|uniref:MYND-type domain-containing protein n=1 Tax=Favolaschia claudopus TaxID=2862362 RepID=A0AAW0BY56_9AGAR
MSAELLLDGDFDASTATTGFDTIETSNIADHVGVLNVLITAVPLLAHRPSSVLHTSLLIDKDEGKTKPSNLTKLLCADISTISIFLGVAPVGCVSQFTSSTKTHEILDSASYRERISWKCPYLTDTQSDITPSFSDARALANLLFGIYEQMFADETWARVMSRSEPGPDIFHYHRATFAALLGVVKSRIRSDWSAVMHHIFDRLHKDRTLLMGSNNYQEFCCQLHLRGVYEVDILSKPPPISRNHSLFREWKKVPSVVSLVLVVPREKIRILEARRRGSPMFQCELQGRTFTNIFSSIRAVLGTVSVHGTGNDTRVDITEDPKGWSGTAPLVVSVSLPTFNLLVDEPRYMRISLGLHPTPSTSAGFARDLGLQLQLYTTNIMDTAHVHITDMSARILLISSPKQDVSSVSVTLDDECRISSMSARWEPQIGLKGVGVSHVQMSPCAIRVRIDGREKDLVYPFPIDGSKTKVKIARTSGWIELEVPVRPLLASTDLSFTTAVVQNQYPIVWDIHRLNLESLPLLPGDIHSQEHPMIYLNCFLAMSDREHALGVASLAENPLVLVKHTILQLFGHFVDPSTKPRPFVFSDPENGGMYTVLYVNGIRVDAASHTYVMDACVLTLTKDLVKGPRGPYIVALLSELDAEDIITVGKEVGAWKHLLKTCRYGIIGMPVSKDMFDNPLCDCGAGVGLGAILQDVLWTPFAPLMTRVAISPFFALPYLETVNERLHKIVCAACDKPGYLKQAKLLKCGRCKAVQYCGKVCQLSHWTEHKSVCKAV